MRQNFKPDAAKHMVSTESSLSQHLDGTSNPKFDNWDRCEELQQVVLANTSARSSTTTTTIVETKNDVSANPARSSKRTLTDDLHSTFSSPMAWILVLALIVTWSAVAVIMFDLLDSKGLEGGIQHISTDPMKAVSDAMDDSTDWLTSILTFMTNLVAPEEEEEEDDQSEEKDDDDEVQEADIAIALGIVADAGADTDVEAQETGEEAILFKAGGESELLTSIEESAAKADDAVADLADSQDGLSATDIPFDDHDDKTAKELTDDHGEVTEDSLKDETGAGLKDADAGKDITITTPVVSSEPGGDETTVVADEDDGSSPEQDITTLKEEEKDESAEEVEIAEKAPEPEPVPKGAAKEVKEKEAEEPVAEAEKEAEADKVKKREPAAPKEKEKAKAAPAKKEATVAKAKVKPSVEKKGPTAVKERPKRTERVITKEKAKSTSTKKEPAVTKKAKITTTSHKAKKKVASTPKAKQAIKEKVVGTPVPDEKKTAEETQGFGMQPKFPWLIFTNHNSVLTFLSSEKAAESPAPAKELKVEENVTEGKKPGKIPYFQCVLMSSKSSQYPLRPMSPAMSPAINPTMMRAMMEQRAALLQQKARAAGQ
ncbi:putative serine threonine- kinase kinX [Labeo rohita]|uniref:Putative serine threonine-kinase kinX n=1 Tax=Labeo rohita TaxID=84645 RepID=A0A498LY47_LABRO|nr:putative serine threonine- kinase kinX [Labeo rohita]